MLVGVLIFFANLDVIYVNIMEARNFITAREMVQDGNWLLTTMNADPRYEKPPLPTWLTAISGLIFGFNSLFALRLPAALVSLMLLYFFYRFLPKLKVPEKQSFLGGLILASSFYIIFMGRNGQWDIFTHAFMMAAIFYMFQLFSAPGKLWKNAFLAGLFLAFSIMSKGPVSLYALLLPFLLAYGFTYRFRDLKSKWKPILFMTLFALLLGSWWFLYVRLADPVAFLKITTREATRWTNYNVRPFYYYWSFFTQSGIWTIPAFVALLYPYLKSRVLNQKAYKFTLFWTLAAVVLLSLIPEKKSRYLLPVLIPMAMNTSFYIEYLFRKFAELPKKEKWVVVFNHGLIGFIGILFPFVGWYFLELDGYEFWYIATSITLFSIGAGLFYFLKVKNYPKVFYLTVAFICGILVFGFPLSHALLNNPRFHNIAELRKKAEQQQLPVYEYNNESPELIWEYGKPIPRLEEGELPKEKQFGLLARRKDSIFVNNLEEYEVLEKDRYDLNYVHPEKSGYKDRLIRNFYLLKKKE